MYDFRTIFKRRILAQRAIEDVNVRRRAMNDTHQTCNFLAPTKLAFIKNFSIISSISQYTVHTRYQNMQQRQYKIIEFYILLLLQVTIFVLVFFCSCRDKSCSQPNCLYVLFQETIAK